MTADSRAPGVPDVPGVPGVPGVPDVPVVPVSIPLRLLLSGRELVALLERPDMRPPHVAVVIDVLRATTTITQAFANGAACVRAFRTEKEARAAAADAASAATDRPLLCGERGGLRIPGFDLGNSPSEYTRDRVTGRTLLFVTTNGTTALARTALARHQLLAAYVNLEACASRVLALSQAGEETWLVAAGKEERPCEEDSACARELAGLLLAGRAQGGERFELVEESHELSGAATGASAVPLGSSDAELVRFLAATAHGREMVAIDPSFARDIEAAGQRNVFRVVPEGRAATIVASQSGGA